MTADENQTGVWPVYDVLDKLALAILHIQDEAYTEAREALAASAESAAGLPDGPFKDHAAELAAAIEADMATGEAWAEFVRAHTEVTR